MKLIQRVAEIINVILTCNFEFCNIWVGSRNLNESDKTWPGLNVRNEDLQKEKGSCSRSSNTVQAVEMVTFENKKNRFV